MINLGKHSYCYGVQRGTGNNVNVGNYSCIAEGVLFDGGFEHEQWISTFPLHSIWSDLPSNNKIKGDINIGNQVWICEDAIIFSGVTIGDGAIIGARTIVKNNVAPYEVVVGVDRIVGKRYSDVQIKSLLSIAWYNWPDEKVRENAHLLLSDNIDEFIKLHLKK